MDEAGARWARRRLAEGVAGVAKLHELIAEHAEDPDAVAVGIETTGACGWHRWWPRVSG